MNEDILLNELIELFYQLSHKDRIAAVEILRILVSYSEKCEDIKKRINIEMTGLIFPVILIYNFWSIRPEVI